MVPCGRWHGQQWVIRSGHGNCTMLASGGPEDRGRTAGKPSSGEQKPDLHPGNLPQGGSRVCCRLVRAGLCRFRKRDGLQVTPATTAAGLSHVGPAQGTRHPRSETFLAGKPGSVFLMELQATRRRGGGKGERREAFSPCRWELFGLLWSTWPSSLPPVASTRPLCSGCLCEASGPSR